MRGASDLDTLLPIAGSPGFTGRKPGWGRFDSERVAKWTPLVARLVAEVECVHLDSGRFRHRTRFMP